VRIGSGIVLIGVAFIILYAAAQGKLSCLTNAVDCLFGVNSGTGNASSGLPSLPSLGG